MSIENDQKVSPEKESTEGNMSIDYNAPLMIAWQINQECNIDCLHCCVDAGKVMPNSLNADEAMDFCQRIVDQQIPYVAISGGEPLLHKKFFDACEFLVFPPFDRK